MTETDTKKPTDALAKVEGSQLPAVIENGGAIKPVYLHDIYTGKPGFVIVLSQRFNELAKEQFISPDFSRLQEMGYKVEPKYWNPIERKLDQGTAYDKHEGMVKVITLYPDDINLIEDPMFKGLETTLLPIVKDIETDMEKQLNDEVKRLQKLSPK